MHPTYRPGIGIVLINHFGKVLVARRIDGAASAWQMPQGGIERGESPRDAMLRGLREEIGTDAVEILAESQSWRPYEDDITPTDCWRQKWFLALFKGRDADIKLPTDNPEFDAWRWVSPEELTALAAPAKRQLYREILEEFASPIRDSMMLISASAPGERSGAGLPSHKHLPLGRSEEAEVDGGPLGITDGEVNFIQGFVHDGSIGAECGLHLMRFWGYCERHAWVSLAVEMSVLHGFCSRSATLYADILRQGVAALAPNYRRRAVARALSAGGSCMICSANPTRRGLLSVPELIEAKDPARLRSFAQTSELYWRSDGCPRCISGMTGSHLCRRHLIEALNEGASLNLEEERAHLHNVLARLENYAWSFSWGFNGIDGPEDRAALISAIGWSNGWSNLAAVVSLGHPSSTPHLRSVG